MKAEKLREFTIDELQQKYRDSKEELFNLRFQASTGQLKNNMRIQEVKRDIARIKTILHMKENDK